MPAPTLSAAPTGLPWASETAAPANPRPKDAGLRQALRERFRRSDAMSSSSACRTANASSRSWERACIRLEELQSLRRSGVSGQAPHLVGPSLDHDDLFGCDPVPILILDHEKAVAVG